MVLLTTIITTPENILKYQVEGISAIDSVGIRDLSFDPNTPPSILPVDHELYPISRT